MSRFPVRRGFYKTLGECIPWEKLKIGSKTRGLRKIRFILDSDKARLQSITGKLSGSRFDLMMLALDQLLETHGVESLGECDMHDGPPYLYLNTGDTYATTVMYSRDAGVLFAASWGDVAEEMGL